YESLRAAAAGDHPELDLRERELDVVGCDPEVAGEGELEPHAEGEPLELRDHGLRAALRRGDVPGEVRELRRLGPEEAGDVAAGREHAACAGQHDDSDAVVVTEVGERVRQLVARAERDAV